jgi:short-subunit dehydrogenase
MLLSSVAAVIPAPTRTLYASTKSASLLLYQALSIEHPSIAFTFILPGTIEGDFRASAVDNPPGAPAPKIHEADPNKHGLKREAVADRCMRAIDKAEKMIFTPGYFRAGHISYWVWPTFIEWRARVKYNFKVSVWLSLSRQTADVGVFSLALGGMFQSFGSVFLFGTRRASVLVS